MSCHQAGDIFLFLAPCKSWNKDEEDYAPEKLEWLAGEDGP